MKIYLAFSRPLASAPWLFPSLPWLLGGVGDDNAICSFDGDATSFRCQWDSLGFDGFDELAVSAMAGPAGAGETAAVSSGAARLSGVDSCSSFGCVRLSLRHRFLLAATDVLT